MDYAIYPNMRRKIDDIIGEYLVEISSKSQVHMLYLSKEYKQESQELLVLSRILQRCSKENQKPEEIIPEQSNSNENLSLHGPITNTG